MKLHKYSFICGSLLSLSACKPVTEVQYATVTQSTIEATVSSITSGTVKAEHVTDLAFGGVGRVQELNIKLGEHVKKGQVLSELENNDLRTILEVASSEFARQQELYSGKVSAKQELDRARETYDNAVVALEKSRIRAPFDGLVTEMNLEIGQLSQITAVIPKPLIRIIDEEPRYVRAEIDEVDLARIQLNMPSRIKILAARKEPFNAKVRKVIPAINSVREQDRTATIELTVENEGILLPDGASADVEIIVQRVDNAVAIPSRCVLGAGEKHYVYSSDGKTATRRDVKLGIRGFDMSQILQGVELKERVLIPTDLTELQSGKEIKLIESK